MRNELELWNFVAERLGRGERVALLVVAESSGSSPGRAGYKMAVAEDGELTGSVGGGVMEVDLVERARQILSVRSAVAGELTSELIEQEHRKNSQHPSGMICSGQQTVISKLLSPNDLNAVNIAVRAGGSLAITPGTFSVGTPEKAIPGVAFERRNEVDFIYTERLGPKNDLVIIGGGHCSLALSELMSRMDFSIRIFDDRPELNTIEKNEFANEVTIIERYEDIAKHIPTGENVYVVVMTLGYKTDAVVIRQLLDRNSKYFGVLGSKAKMAALMRELREEGHDATRLSRIRTPIGIPINSHTPEEIAVSIAAEIISLKNS